MAVLGDMVVTLAANTTPYSKGLNKAKGQTRGFVSSVAGTIGRIGKAGAIAAAGAAMVGFGLTVRGVKRQFDELDKIAKTSARIGIASKSLMGLQFAAEQTGGSADMMNNLLLQMQKRISEANSGIGTGKRSLEALGLSIEELAGMNPEQQFFAISDAMKEIGNVGDRSRVAFDLFGRSGTEAINMLSGGSEQLRAFIKEAGGLGRAFDEDQLAQVEQANDAMNRMGSAIKAMWGNIAIAIAPTITAMSDSMSGFAVTAGQALGSVINHTRFIVGNFGDLWSLAARMATLKVVGFGADVAHVLTKNIPELLNWFMGNWRDVFTTIGDFTVAVFSNMGHNIMAAWTNTQNALSEKILELMAFMDDSIDLEAAREELHSMQTGMDFRGLTEGFESSIKEMPKLSSRAMTDLEKSLSKDIDNLSGSLGDEYNKVFNPEVAAAAASSGADIDTDLFTADTKAGKAGGGTGSFGARKGSEEAFKSIVSAMTGRDEKAYQNKSLSLFEKIEANTGKQSKTELAVVEEF